MKKILALTLVVIIGYFLFSVIYSGSKVNAFYTSNKTIYKEGNVKWELISYEKGFFSATYITKLSYNCPYLNFNLPVIDRVVFGTRSFNLGKLGSISSEFKLSELNASISEIFKDVTFNSNIGFSGFSSDIDIDEGSYNSDNLSLSWKPLNIKSYVSFDKNIINSSSNVQYFHAKIDDDIDIEVTNQKYNDEDSFEKFYFGLGKSDFQIEKFSVLIKSTSIALEGLDIKSELNEGENDTLTYLSNMGFKKLIITNENDKQGSAIDDFRANIDFYNIDTKSIINIYDSLQNTDIIDQEETSFGVGSWASYAFDMLKKQPKLVFKDISGKYENEEHKLSGFIHFIRDSKETDYISSEELLSNLSSEIKISIGRNLFLKYLKLIIGTHSDQEHELKTLEDRFNIKTDEKNIQIDFKIKNGKIIINGKEVNQDTL